MKNKMLTIILIVLVTLTLLGVVAAVLIWQFSKDVDETEKEPTIDEIVLSTVAIPEITTNLSSKQFIRLSLTIQTDNEKAAEELTKREFQVKNIVIQELSELTSLDFEGKIGKQNFEESLKALINPLMQNGEIKQVYIVSYIIQ